MSDVTRKPDAETDAEATSASATDSNADSNAESRRDPGEGLPLVSGLRKLDNALGLAEQLLLVGFVLGLIGVASAQAIATKMDVSWDWSFELIRYAVFFIAMTGAALSAQTEQLIAMDFVTRMLDSRARARLRLLLRVFTLVVCVLLVIGGKALSDSAATETLYHAIPPDLGLLALPIGAGLIAFHVLVHMIVDAIYMSHGLTPPEPEMPTAH